MGRRATGARPEDAFDISSFGYDFAENREGELRIPLAEAEERGAEGLELAEEEVIGGESGKEIDLLLHWLGLGLGF